MNSRDSDERAGTHHRLHRRLADGGFDDRFFRTLVECVGVGVAVYDETGAFAYANDAFASILGAEAADVVGRFVWDVNPTVDESRFGAYWESFDVGETRDHQVQFEWVDGETVTVETVTTAIEVDDVVYHVGTIADVSDRLADLAEMERQDERLTEVASVISHDLRNPLNVAMGRAELAAMDCDSEHLDYVERSLRKMEALIADVLTVVREGSRITDPEPRSLEEAVSTAWYEATDTDAATLTVADDLGTVATEGSRLTALFGSLFENAIDHAGPDVDISVGRLDDGFYVADDGPGWPEDITEDVFDYGVTTTEEGTGFGLTIVEHVAAAHGWEVSASESDAGGATVEVRGVDFVD